MGHLMSQLLATKISSYGPGQSCYWPHLYHLWAKHQPIVGLSANLHLLWARPWPITGYVKMLAEVNLLLRTL